MLSKMSFREMDESIFVAIPFFYKLNYKIRYNLDCVLLLELEQNEINIRDILKDLTKENAVSILEHADDYTFHQVHFYFTKLQPIVEQYIKYNNLYEQYPEYLI